MTLSRRVLVGFSLAMVVALTVVGSVLLGLAGLLRPQIGVAAGAVAAVGLILFMRGRWVLGRVTGVTPGEATAPENHPGEHPLGFFKRPDYWGCILLLSALPIFLLTQSLSRPRAVAAKPLPPAKVAPVAVVTPPVVVVKSPELKLQGLVCNGSRSAAVINGQTVGIGERAGGAKILAIEPWGITVEMDGGEQRLILP